MHVLKQIVQNDHARARGWLPLNYEPELKPDIATELSSIRSPMAHRQPRAPEDTSFFAQGDSMIKGRTTARNFVVGFIICLPDGLPISDEMYLLGHFLVCTNN